MLNAEGAASQVTCIPLMAYATVRVPSLNMSGGYGGPMVSMGLYLD